jgi:hypothetical protein
MPDHVRLWIAMQQQQGRAFAAVTKVDAHAIDVALLADEIIQHL